MKKAIVFLVAVVAFITSVQTADAQIRTTKVDISDELREEARTNQAATGKSDNDLPSIRYVNPKYSIPTIGELKKITVDHITGLGYTINIVEIKNYWHAYDSAKAWHVVSKSRSREYPDYDYYVTREFLYKRIPHRPNSEWKLSYKSIKDWYVKRGSKDLAIN